MLSRSIRIDDFNQIFLGQFKIPIKPVIVPSIPLKWGVEPL